MIGYSGIDGYGDSMCFSFKSLFRGARLVLRGLLPLENYLLSFRESPLDAIL